MPESTLGEVVQSNERLAAALDRLTARVEGLPDVIDRTYVRKDVAQEQARRIDGKLAELAHVIEAEQEERKRLHADLEAQIDKLIMQVRFTVSAVIVPTGLAIVSIVINARGGK